METVVCLMCGYREARTHFDARLAAANPGYLERLVVEADQVNPDGDVTLDESDVAAFRMAGCERCGSELLKPDVVYFGEALPDGAIEKSYRLAAQAEEAERQKKLAEIRRQREQAARQAELAEQKLRQLQQVQQRQTAAATPSQGTPGQGGTSEDLTAKYAAAIQQAVTAQWIRPDTVPLGQRCRVSIRQLPGGEVIDVQVQAGCPFDEAGRRSLEAAVLRAQPLPYRGFENVFQRNLTLNFEAQDR